MIEEYLAGSIGQILERVRQLRQIAQGQHPREYDGLRQVCLLRLDDARRNLDRLLDESIVDTSLQSPRRVREFKRVVESVNAIESVGIFALTRSRPEDDFLNRLITDVCREISYPLIMPVVSQMSQDYFHIYPEFALLCVPLIEGRFLLHLPDLYHELCHPIHSRQNADLPNLEPYHAAYRQSLFAMVEHFGEEAHAAERLSHREGQIYHIELWRNCWIKYWMEEFFCDLFGVLTVGPAFVWSHYHLCIKRGGDPFETPLRFQMRMRQLANNDKRLKSGGKAKYLLSGLMYCEACGANYVMGDRDKYACSSYIHGRACSNDVRVRRDTAEAVVLYEIRKQLRDPDRLALMVTEMQRHLIQLFKEHAARSSEAPQELKELDARLERLRKRLKEGDPDIAADELQAAIERAEAKRRQLKNGLQDHSEVTKVISAIPRAAALCDQRITLGLSGDGKASEEARVVLRQLIPDRIRLSPKEDGSLWAHSALQPAALLVATGYRGRGEGICSGAT